MILITGANGNNGKEIVQGLSSQAVPVRAMVRKNSSAPQPSSNIECVEADFDNADTVRQALDNVESAFLVSPSSEKVEEQQLRFVALAREAGVKHLVYLSQLHAAADSPVRFLRYHAVVEQAIADSGMSYTHLRPNLYMQALLLFKDLIASKGQIMAPVGTAPVSAVDVRDIAAVAVESLAKPGHAGKIYDITGPQALTHAEMAEQLSISIGKPIHFIDIAPKAMRDALLSVRMPAWQADGLVEDYAHYSRGEAATLSTTVLDVTGRTPRSFRDFANDYKASFLETSPNKDAA